MRYAIRFYLATGLAVLALAASTACSSSASQSTSSSPSCSATAAPSGVPASSFAADKATGSPVKVGVINAEGGPAVSQPTSREAAQAATRYANDHLGGLAGHPIQLVICKSQEDSASAIACANQMVEAKVVGVVVTASSFGNTIAPIIIRAGIPYTTYNGTSAAELTAKNYSYAWTSGFPGVLKGMATYAVQSKVRSLVMYILDLPAVAIGAQSEGMPIFKAAGVSLKIIPVPAGTPDATPQVSAGLQSDPGAVAIVGDAGTCISVLKALHTLGNNRLQMVNQSCTDPSVVQGVGSALNGTRVLSGADGTSNDPEALLYRAVMAQYAPGVTTAGPSLTGYQSMLGFIRMAKGAAEPASAASVNAAIRSAKDVPAPAGHGATMTCDGTADPSLPMICNTTGIVATITDGQLTGAELIK